MLGLGPISGAPVSAFTAPAAVVGPLAGSVVLALTSTGTLTGTGWLAGHAPLGLGLSGDLRGVADARGVAAAGLSAAGTLSARAAVAGRGGVGVNATGMLSARAGAAGVAAAGLSAVATLSARAAAVARAALRADATGGLSAAALLQARATAAFAATATVSSTFEIRIPTTYRLRVRPWTNILTNVSEATVINTKRGALTTIAIPDITMINVGDVARLDADFFVDGVLTDPTTVTLIVKPPGAASVTYAYPTDPHITKTATGKYRGLVDCSTAGIWHGRWVTTGAAAGAEEFSFTVIANTF